jgi:hypothetical protein
MTATVRYGGPVVKSDGTEIVLPEQDFVLFDVIEPDRSVGEQGERGALLCVDESIDPEGVVFVSAAAHNRYLDS